MAFYDIYFYFTAAVGSSGSTGATRVAGGSQTLNSGTVIQGSGNAVSSLANVAPQVGLDIDLLNAVTQTGGGGGGAGLLGGLLGGGAANNLGGHLPPTPRPTLPPTLPPLPPTLRPTPPLTLPPTVPPTPPTLLLTLPLYPPTYPTALNVPYAYPPQPPSPSYLAPPLPPQFPKANCFEITDYDLNGNKGQSRIVCVPPPSPPTRRCFLRRCNKWSNQADTSCCFENHPHSQPHAPIPAPAPAPIYESPQPGQIESPINLRYDHFYP
ncbi:spore coat protein SP85-like [Rhagoletis pomonella]|uniref:spore coat protein SP85-like n=1 Tax=Rhagoletis pomonella TaxID=28610 RepID=UPI0017836252|nr:spore coat protein SP85-like [Rhagoletis pomonella]